MLRTWVFRESGCRIFVRRLLLYIVVILIFQQATAGRLLSSTAHGADAVRHRGYVGRLRRPRFYWGSIRLRSAIFRPKTAIGMRLNAVTAAFASAGAATLATAGIIALRRKRTTCDLFSPEEIRRGYLDSSLGGALSSFALGAAAALSTINECWQIELGVGVALFALLLFGISRSGIPANIESAKLDQISYQLNELGRELTMLKRLTRPAEL